MLKLSLLSSRGRAIGRNEVVVVDPVAHSLAYSDVVKAISNSPITVAGLVEVARHASRIVPRLHAARIKYDLAKFEPIG